MANLAKYWRKCCAGCEHWASLDDRFGHCCLADLPRSATLARVTRSPDNSHLCALETDALFCCSQYTRQSAPILQQSPLAYLSQPTVEILTGQHEAAMSAPTPNYFEPEQPLSDGIVQRINQLSEALGALEAEICRLTAQLSPVLRPPVSKPEQEVEEHKPRLAPTRSPQHDLLQGILGHVDLCHSLLLEVRQRLDL